VFSSSISKIRAGTVRPLNGYQARARIFGEAQHFHAGEMQAVLRENSQDRTRKTSKRTLLLRLYGLDEITHEHGDGQRADATGNRRNV